MRAAARLALACVAAAPTLLHGRLEFHRAFVDLAGMIGKAPVIVRGVIVAGRPPLGHPGLVRLKVQRVYRGGARAGFVDVRVANGLREPGHDCASFAPGTHWVIFATPDAQGSLELSHDCYGALPVSGLLAAAMPRASIERQLEADFAEGLTDPHLPSRIMSLHRLSNLRLASSIPLLHQHAQTYRGQREADWAALAAFRCGNPGLRGELPQRSRPRH